jgi:hypothetical protein
LEFGFDLVSFGVEIPDFDLKCKQVKVIFWT